MNKITLKDKQEYLRTERFGYQILVGLFCLYLNMMMTMTLPANTLTIYASSFISKRVVLIGIKTNKEKTYNQQ